MGRSSSDEDDGDDEWRAAINSVVATVSGGTPLSTKPLTEQRSSPKDKLWQIKVRKFLDEKLEKSLEFVSVEDSHLPEEPQTNVVSGFRLLRNPPPAVASNEACPKGPRKRPRIIPGTDIREASKQFQKQVKSVAVDGDAIISAAKAAMEKSLSKREASEAATKAAARREEERVAELKKVRGERWLPSMRVRSS